MNRLFLLICFACTPFQAAVSKEVPGDTDIAIASEDEIAAARLEREAESFPSTVLTRELQLRERNAKARQAEQLATHAPLAIISIKRALLARPTERAVDVNAPSTGWGVPRQLSRLSLTLDGVEYVLGVVDESPDAKRGLVQVTAAVLNTSDGVARFTIDDRTGLLAGTLRGTEAAYRIVSIDRNTQAVYRLAADASAATKMALSSKGPAHSVEKRHVQLEMLSQVAPTRARMARNDLSVSIDGGALGSIDTRSVTAQSVVRALQRLQPLTNAAGTEKLRILSTEAGRIRYVQLINGIPVLRQNELAITPTGKISRLKSALVDETWAPSAPMIPQHQASELARQALEQRADVPGGSLAEATPSTLWYHVDGPNRTLIPRYAFFLQSKNGPVYEVAVDAITGEASVDTAGSRALGDEILTYVCKRVSGSPTVCQTNDANVELIKYEIPGGGSACPFAGQPGGWKCTSYADVQVAYQHATELDKNWETVTSSAPGNRCCEMLGTADRVGIVIDTPAAVGGASFYKPTKSILFGPTGPASVYNTDVLIHEHMHAYFYDYNFSNYTDTGFGGAVNEGLGDVMAAAYKLKHPGGTDQPWVWGDGSSPLPVSPVNLQRDMTVDRDFSYIDAHISDPHEASKAISNYFYRLYRDSGMTPDRLMLLTLVVADDINDAEGNGLDLEDFQEAVFSAVSFTEPTLFNQVLSTWLSMNQLAAPIPSAPTVVNGSPIGCSGGFSYYNVVWSASANASAYGGYLRDPNGVTYTRKNIFSQDTTSGVAFTNYNTDAKFTACNGSGCSSMSVDSHPMPHSLCF